RRAWGGGWGGGVGVGLGPPLLRAARGGQLVLAVRRGQPAPAHRLSPGDRRVLAGLERPGGRPDRLVRQGQPHQQALKDLAVPCKPPTRSSRWQQGWSPPVASALPWGDKDTALACRLRSSSDNRG